MISPVKASVGPGYDDLDKRLAAAIHIRFGLPAVTAPMLKKQIKKADKISAWLEATQLAGFSREEADRLFGKVDATLTDSLTLHLRPPLEVRQDFTAKHVALLAQM
jgi:5'-deoxynucleotidase YfbR-like HD superfamily hydrolase